MSLVESIIAAGILLILASSSAQVVSETNRSLANQVMLTQLRSLDAKLTSMAGSLAILEHNAKEKKNRHLAACLGIGANGCTLGENYPLALTLPGSSYTVLPLYLNLRAEPCAKNRSCGGMVLQGWFRATCLDGGIASCTQPSVLTVSWNLTKDTSAPETFSLTPMQAGRRSIDVSLGGNIRLRGISAACASGEALQGITPNMKKICVTLPAPIKGARGPKGDPYVPPASGPGGSCPPSPTPSPTPTPPPTCETSTPHLQASIRGPTNFKRQWVAPPAAWKFPKSMLKITGPDSPKTEWDRCKSTTLPDCRLTGGYVCFVAVLCEYKVYHPGCVSKILTTERTISYNISAGWILDSQPLWNTCPTKIPKELENLICSKDTHSVFTEAGIKASDSCLEMKAKKTWHDYSNTWAACVDKSDYQCTTRNKCDP